MDSTLVIKNSHTYCKNLQVIKSSIFIEEVYRSGAIKINNFKGTNTKVVNGQRIKHYISCNPINIETVTLEEYIRDTFQNVSDSERE